jgi:biopolymer transport protein ExbB/TolQ
MKNNHLFVGILIAAGISAISCFGYYASPRGSGLETFFFALGGKMPDGLIQFATFASFFICLFGIQEIQKRLRAEESLYAAKLLPESEQYVLYAEDVNRIKLETIEVERRVGGQSMLTDLIKQAATKFRANNSTAESLSIVETMSDMQRRKLEKDFWVINICQTLIPAFGFLGTVWGMAAAILSMGKAPAAAVATTPTAAAGVAAPVVNGVEVQSLIDSMGTAFFTTIVSIVLGIIISVLAKKLESKVEDFHTTMKHYVVENLVNRIHL